MQDNLEGLKNELQQMTAEVKLQGSMKSTLSFGTQIIY